jgi:hypothetical protein
MCSTFFGDRVISKDLWPTRSQDKTARGFFFLWDLLKGKIYRNSLVSSTTSKKIQGDRKVTQPIPDTCSLCQKINCIEIRKQKNNVIWSVGNVHRIQRWMHPLFSSCWMQPGEEFLQWRLKCTAQYFVSIRLMSGTGESGNVSLKSFWQVN